MAGLPRIEFAGPVYQVNARGDQREDICLGDQDRTLFLEVPGDVCDRSNWWCHVYCLISNDYQLLLETPLSPAPFWIDCYTTRT